MKTKKTVKKVSLRKKEKIAFLKRFRKAISRNMKVPLLTKAQVLKWYNMSPDLLDKMPVALFVNGEPRYFEHQLDREIVVVLDGTVFTVDHEAGQMVAVSKIAPCEIAAIVDEMANKSK